MEYKLLKHEELKFKKLARCHSPLRLPRLSGDLGALFGTRQQTFIYNTFLICSYTYDPAYQYTDPRRRSYLYPIEIPRAKVYCLVKVGLRGWAYR
jgi:hypothetical protein